MSAPRAPAPTRTKRWLFSVVVALLVAGTGEVLLRLAMTTRVGPRVLLYGTPFHRRHVAPADTLAHTVQSHENVAEGYTKYFPHEKKRDHDRATGESFSVTINACGFRGDAFSGTKPPGTVRIVTLGASSTFGYFNRDDETYPHQLEEILDRRWAGAPSLDAEVLNLGIPHLRSREILALFRAEALPLAPDVVTFYEGANDAATRAEPPPRAGATPGSGGETGLGGFRSALLGAYRAASERLLTVKLLGSLATAGGVVTYSREDLERHLTGKRERFLANLTEIHDACDARGIVFIVVTQPSRSREIEELGDKTFAEEARAVRERLASGERADWYEIALVAHKELNDALREWAAERKVPLVDGIARLDGRREELASWVHLTPRGNRILAEALADEIERHVGPPRGASRR